MANELFKFTIIDYTTNPLGDSTIIEEPVGWDGVEFELTRLETHGFVNRINIDGIDFEFRGDAKVILDTAYNNYGVDAKIELQIEWRGNPTDSFQVIYKGLFKLNTYEVVCGVDCFTKCGIVQDGCYHLFANRKNKSVDLSSVISFDGSVLSGYADLNRPITLPAKGLRLENKTKTDGYTFSTQGTFDGTTPAITAGFTGYDMIILTIPESNVLNEDLRDQLHISQTANDSISTGVTGIFNLADLTNSGEFTQQLIMEKVKKLKCNNTYTLTMDINLDITLSVQSVPTLELLDYSRVHFMACLYNPNLDNNDPLQVKGIFRGTLNFLPTPVNSTTISIVENFTRTFEIPDGYYLYYGIIMEAVSRTSAANDYFITCDVNKYDYSLVNESLCDDSVANVSFINETLSRTVESYTNDCIRVKSDYFGRTDSDPYTSDNDGCGSLEVISSGLQVRGAYDESNTQFDLKTSFDDVFNGLQKIHNVGYGLEDDANRGGYKWLRVEPYQYFYQNTSILTCDYPTIVNKKVDSEQIYSRILVGYNAWESVEAGGLQDLFAEREYQTNLTRANKTIDLRSNLIASDFALEVTRRLYGVSKIDWKFDNDLFIICIKRNGINFEVETGDDIVDSSTFIYSPNTLKNARLTPIRNLLRHVPRLVEYIKPSLNYLLTFLNGKANYIASIKLNSDPCVLEDLTNELAEYASIEVSTYDTASDGTPIIASEIVSFEYPISCADWANIMANPYGKIAYNCPNDLDYKYGYIKQIKFNPTQGIAEITLKQAYA